VFPAVLETHRTNRRLDAEPDTASPSHISAGHVFDLTPDVAAVNEEVRTDRPVDRETPLQVREQQGPTPLRVAMLVEGLARNPESIGWEGTVGNPPAGEESNRDRDVDRVRWRNLPLVARPERRPRAAQTPPPKR
jgi:hypothetical protein